MKLNQITTCFPSIKDWEDSYLKDGRQRLLGTSGDLQVEILLDKEIEQVAVYFAKVGNEIFGLVSLFIGHQVAALAFLEESSVFIGHNPNTPYEKILGEYRLRMSQILGKDYVTNTLTIRLAANPPAVS